MHILIFFEILISSRPKWDQELQTGPVLLILMMSTIKSLISCHSAVMTRVCKFKTYYGLTGVKNPLMTAEQNIRDIMIEK